MTSSRIAWVTGGSRGIGRATALRLARDGHDIAVGYHENVDAANEVVHAIEETGRRAIAVPGDLADLEQAESAHRTVVNALGAPNIVVASHGIYTRGPFGELDPATWQRTIDVNLTGAYHATRLALPKMRDTRWGRLVYLGSILGRIGSEHGAHYAATKAALIALARSIAKECARDGVTANVVSPGAIETDILAGDTPEKRNERERTIPVGRVGQPEEIAAAIAYLVSEEAGYVTGTELRVDGGFMMG